MEFWVVFFTITCLVCASICFASLGRPLFSRSYGDILSSSFNMILSSLERTRNGGGRVARGSRKKTRYVECVKEYRKSIDEFFAECESMMLSKEQCQLLRLECLRLVPSTHSHSVLKESFCAIRRALKLMQDCCSKDWLLKAVEFGNCQGHFLEILLDLHRLPVVVNLVGFEGESLDDIAPEFKSIGICQETLVEIGRAWSSDKETLRELMSKIRPDCRDHYLADQLNEKPSLKKAPDDIGRFVTQFPILKSECIYSGFGDMYVLPVTLWNKEFKIKMRYSKVVGAKDKKLKNEANFMRKCRHPYAVGLLGYWKAERSDGPEVPLLLMESMECNLETVIERNKRWWWGSTGGFSALEAINLVLPVAKVMKYLHGIQVVHRDLKPQNILFAQVPGTQHLAEDVSVKLADFGDAQKVDEAKGKAGTFGYMDPDVWGGKTIVDHFKADVFSFGMVFGEVLTGKPPGEALGCMYDSEDGPYLDVKEFYSKLQGGEQIQLPPDTNKHVKSIVESCWNRLPAKRPSFDDICWKLQNTEFLLRNGCARGQSRSSHAGT